MSRFSVDFCEKAKFRNSKNPDIFYISPPKGETTPINLYCIIPVRNFKRSTGNSTQQC
jgi:hypothetical protein